MGGFPDGVDGLERMDVATGVATTVVAWPTGVSATIACVPTISRFFGLMVVMYFDDHGHPHFHVRHAEGAAKIRIDVVEVIDSNLPTRRLRIALAWAELHQLELLEKLASGPGG